MPTSKDFRQRGLAGLKSNWGTAILLLLVAGLLGSSYISFSVTYSISNFGELSDLWQYGYRYDYYDWITAVNAWAYSGYYRVASLYSLVCFVIGGAADLGVCHYFYKLNTREKAGFEDLFGRFKIFGKALGLRLLTWLIVAAWSLLFVIPGIIAAYRLSMAPWLMAQNPNLSVSEALEGSRQLMSDKKGSLFVLHLSFIGWAILCLFTLGLGYIALAPYIRSAEAAFFIELTAARPEYQATAEASHMCGSGHPYGEQQNSSYQQGSSSQQGNPYQQSNPYQQGGSSQQGRDKNKDPWES